MENPTNPLQERFITTVNLSINYNENKYQFLYATQLNGTLLGIYGKFESHTIDDKRYIQRITFKLINYKGCVNYGLIERAHEFNNTKKKDVIKLFVKPLTLSDPTKEHLLFPGNGLEVSQGSEILFDRVCLPYNQRVSGENDNGDGQNNIFFDQEYNYRDGYFESPQPPRAGHADYNGDKAMASPRCHQSNVMITF